MVVVPNTHYWDNAKTVLQKVPSCQLIRNPQPLSVISRGILYHRILPEKYVSEAVEGYSGEVYTPPQLGTYYYAFNTQKGRRPISVFAWH